MSRTIFISGATGKQGGSALKDLLQSPAYKDGSIHIRALTRNIESPSAQKLSAQGVELVKGDLEDPISLRSALQDVDSAFLMTMPSITKGADCEITQGKTFIDTAKEAGVRHIVFTSVEGAQRNSGIPHFDSKFQVEEHLRASGISYTILRPVAFMDNFPKQGGFARCLVLGIFNAALLGKRLHQIAVQDIGVVAGKALLEPGEFRNREIALAGDNLSVQEVVEAYEQVQGSKPWVLWLPAFIISCMPHDVKKMFLWFRSTGYQVNVEEVKRIHPGLLSFKEWLSLGSSS